MTPAGPWEALRHGKPVAERPSRESARCYVRDEVEQRVGDLVDALAWHPDGAGEALWLRVDGAKTQSGWEIRPVRAGGGRRG
jgi:hypothetical protein